MNNHEVEQRGKDTSTSVIPREDLRSAANNNTVKGVLTRVYKFFMVSFGKDKTAVWNRLMDNYVNNPDNNVPELRGKRTSIRGNMKREYLGSQLSWPKFVEALRFSGFKKLEIVFIAEDEFGNRQSMREELNFSDIPDNAFEENLVESRVFPAREAKVEEAFDAMDAREAIIGSRMTKTRSSDWASRPETNVDEIILNNIVSDQKK